MLPPLPLLLRIVKEGGGLKTKLVAAKVHGGVSAGCMGRKRHHSPSLAGLFAECRGRCWRLWEAAHACPTAASLPARTIGTLDVVHGMDLEVRPSLNCAVAQVPRSVASATIDGRRGAASRLHLDQCRAVSSAFHTALESCSELWFAAAPDPTLTCCSYKFKRSPQANQQLASFDVNPWFSNLPQCLIGMEACGGWSASLPGLWRA